MTSTNSTDQKLLTEAYINICEGRIQDAIMGVVVEALRFVKIHAPAFFGELEQAVMRKDSKRVSELLRLSSPQQTNESALNSISTLLNHLKRASTTAEFSFALGALLSAAAGLAAQAGADPDIVLAIGANSVVPLLAGALGILGRNLIKRRY